MSLNYHGKKYGVAAIEASIQDPKMLLVALSQNCHELIVVLQTLNATAPPWDTIMCMWLELMKADRATLIIYIVITKEQIDKEVTLVDYFLYPNFFTLAFDWNLLISLCFIKQVDHL